MLSLINEAARLDAGDQLQLQFYIGIAGLVAVIIYTLPALFGLSNWTYVHVIVLLMCGGLSCYLMMLALTGTAI